MNTVAYHSLKFRSHLKKALLVVAFLLGFFSLAAHVAASQQSGRVAQSEQLFIASPTIKRSIRYYRSIPGHFVTFAPTGIWKQNTIATILFTQKLGAKALQNARSFLFVKPKVAYLISHQFLSAGHS